MPCVEKSPKKSRWEGTGLIGAAERSMQCMGLEEEATVGSRRTGRGRGGRLGEEEGEGRCGPVWGPTAPPRCVSPGPNMGDTL